MVHPPSSCPSCGERVRPVDNVPIVSWMLLRGRCRHCAWPIPATYPLVELLGGLTGLLIYRRFLPTPAELDVPNVAAAVVYFVFASALIIGAHVDVRHRILPDQVTLGGLAVGLVSAAVLEGVGYTGWLDIGWRGAAMGALAGGAFFGFIAGIAWLSTGGKEALGFGDVKLLAMIGAFLGPHPALFVICMGASLTMSVVGLLAIAITGRRSYLPFGPALAAWALAYLFYGDILLPRTSPLWLPHLL